MPQGTFCNRMLLRMRERKHSECRTDKIIRRFTVTVPLVLNIIVNDSITIFNNNDSSFLHCALQQTQKKSKASAFK